MARVIFTSASSCHGAKILGPFINRLPPNVANGLCNDTLLLLSKKLGIILKCSCGIYRLTTFRAGGKLYNLCIRTNGFNHIMIRISETPLRCCHMEMIRTPVIGNLRPIMPKSRDRLKDEPSTIPTLPSL